MAKNVNGSGGGPLATRLHRAATSKGPGRIQPSPPSPRRYFASIHPGPDKDVSPEFAKQVIAMEALLGMPLWLVVQNGRGDWNEISAVLFKGFQSARAEIEPDKPVALLIESPGGDPDYAYRISRMLQRRTGNKLTVAIPQFAKSAATLIALGAKSLILGRDAELGPLDVQIFDFDREDFGSALNTVQSLERLNAFALTAVDQTMFLLGRRTGKRTDVLLPHVLTYVATFLRPLLEKIDTSDYTKKSRDLKLTEEYAVRLMKQNYPFETARRIARQLVEKYPTHGFVIDYAESCGYSPVTQQGETFGLGLSLEKVPAEKKKMIDALFEKMTPFLDTLTVVGRIKGVK